MQVGTAVRFVFREAALIVLLAGVLDADASRCRLHARCDVVARLAGRVFSAGDLRRQRRHLPVVTRNVDLSELRISDPPPRLLTVNHSWKMLFLDVPAVMGGLIADITDDFTWSLAGISLAIVTGARRLRGHRTVRAQEQAPRRQGPRPARGERPDTRATPRRSCCLSAAHATRPTRRTCGWRPSPG